MYSFYCRMYCCSSFLVFLKHTFSLEQEPEPEPAQKKPEPEPVKNGPAPQHWQHCFTGKTNIFQGRHGPKLDLMNVLF